MKRHLLVAGITTALALGGWGGVLAAAMCADGWHLSGAGHSCCEGRHGDEEGHQEAWGRSEHAPATDTTRHCPEDSRQGEGDDAPLDAQVGGLRNNPAGSCAHCVARSEDRTTAQSLRGSGQEREQRDALRPSVRALVIKHSPSFTPSIIPKQGAPPGGNERRLMLSVFLI